MKTKFLLTLLLAVCAGYTSLAQSVSVGPRLGANFSTVNASGEDAEMYNEMMETSTGLQFGAVSNVQINDMFSVQPELLFVQKGAKLSFLGMTGSTRSNYLEMPILGKVAFGTELIKGYVTAGPTMGYLLSGKDKYEDEGDKIVEDYDFEDEYYKRLELGASIGVGAAYMLGSREVNLDVRYGLGLSNLYDDSEDSSSKTKNRGFSVSLAYLFNLK